MTGMDWKTELTFEEGGKTWPFVEDEDANITGYGHQDPAEFAAAINAYDAHCNGEPIPERDWWTANDISHRWGVPRVDQNGDWRLIRADADTFGAIPVTTLWGKR